MNFLFWLACLSASYRLIGGEWVFQAGAQIVQASTSGNFLLQNMSAPDAFGENGPGTPPDFVGDDFVRIIGIQSRRGTNVYGFSERFQVRQSAVYSLTDFTLAEGPPRQADRLTIASLNSSIPAGGEPIPLQVTATYADGTTADVTPRTAWTSYRVSNPALATLSPDGLLTPRAPGTVFVTAMNEAATAVRAFTIVDAQQPLTGVAGMVVDELGNPVAGARVVVEPLEGIEGVTDAAGLFELRGVPIPSTGGEIRVTRGTGIELECALKAVTAAPHLVADLGVIQLRRVPPPPGPNLLAWWSGDLGLRDSAGTNDLVIRGAAAMGDGVVGDGFNLPTRGSYFEAPQVGNYAISNKFTVAAWIRASAIVASQVMVSQYDSSTSQQSWSFGFRDGILAMNSQLGDFRNFREWQSKLPVLHTNRWMFFAASLDMASTNIQLFVDGVRVETQVYQSTSQYWAQLRRSTTPVRLGVSVIGGFGGAIIASPFHGQMDEVCLWDRALSASEIADLYRRSCREPQIVSWTGRVLASDGRPLAGARVSSTGNDTYVETDLQGRFALSEIPLGSAPIQARATGVDGGFEVCATIEAIPSGPGTTELGDLIAVRTEDPPRDGMIGWWSANQGLEDRAETNALRAIGNQRIGAGRIGTGLRLDGTTGFFIAPWSQTGTLSNQLSFATWLKLESTAQAQAIASQHASIISSDIGWYFGSSGKKAQLWLYETGWGGNAHLIETRDEVLVDGEWTWLGFSVDTEANQVILMVNGQVVEMAPNTGPIPWNSFNATVTPLFLGGYLGRSNNMLGMLRGEMDEVMLWRRALTVDELSAVAQRGCGVTGVNLGSE